MLVKKDRQIKVSIKFQKVKKEFKMYFLND